METLIRILVISDDKIFVARLSNLVAHPQVIVDSSSTIPKDIAYHFYVVGESIRITEAVDEIREISEGSSIYLAGSVCEKNVPVRKMVKCNIVDCIENDSGMQRFTERVSSFREQKAQMQKASSKLDRLKSGDLKSLAKQMQKIESDRFVDFVKNHTLPIVLIDCDGFILHANTSFESIIGTKLPGIPIAKCCEDSNMFDKVASDLKGKGHILGREVSLKNIEGGIVRMKLYTSLHTNTKGEWLNTRCLFVPIDSD